LRSINRINERLGYVRTEGRIEVPGCKDQEIVRVGRQTNSGTYVNFRVAALQEQGRYDMGILDMLSSKDVVQIVEHTPCAIGYSGLAYATPKVKMACVSKDETSPCVLPSIASASDKSYPIALLMRSGSARIADDNCNSCILYPLDDPVVLLHGLA